ncbi:ATP-binding protein [Solwaraspora sp. WMMD1047]|uniref:ATP-binding protein n=1 Tax=Solwaraspora sp. WMMD1047 TaxID=3016102 RepID=UPI002416A205|nr:ATP-binding protein [Solwaraspora sp. WMMD1047]MDG4827856.1 ATP-binding protein [Solwaraspora sp. WMMD1047]
MTRSNWTGLWLALLGLAAVGSAVAAVSWGLRGVEVAGWIAGIGSFLLAGVALLLVNSGGGGSAKPANTFLASLGGKIRRMVLPAAGNTVRATTGGVIEDVLVGEQRPVAAEPSAVSEPAGLQTVIPPATPISPPQISPSTQPQTPPPAPPSTQPSAPPALTNGSIRITADGLVGRDAQLDRLISGIRAGRGGTFVVLGGHGMGKTSFLDQLRAVVERDLPDVVLLPHRGMTVEPYGLDEAYRGEYGEHATINTLALRFKQSTQLLGDLVQDLDGQFSGFVTAVEGSRGEATAAVTVYHNLTAKTWGRISNADLPTTNVYASGRSPQERLHEAQGRVDKAFVADWRTFLAGRRGVLVLDGFETLIDDVVGQWFVGLAARLTDTVVVLPMVPREYAEHGRAVLDPALAQELPKFSLPEVTAYLDHHFGDRSGPALASVVMRYTGGHPYGLKLVVQFIRSQLEQQPARSGQPLNAEDLRDLLQKLTSNDELPVDALVKAVVAPHRNPEVWQIVETVSLLNTFDVPMVRQLLAAGDDAMDQVVAGNALQRIERLGLLDPLPIDGRFRLHDFIRPALSRALRQFQPARWEEIHRGAASYYYDKISSFEDKTHKTYGSWFKFEDPLWQMYEAEWLFHSAQLPDQRDLTRTQFVVIFLEAFWWWALYIDFPFCHSLLDNWQRASRDDRDRTLLDQLGRFHRNYPVGWDKRPGPHWTEARRALRTIGELCDLHRGWRDPAYPAETQEVRRQAWLYLRLFTAHTLWYDKRYDAADAAYRDLEPEFAELDDELLLAWFYYEWADIAAGAGDRRAAAGRVGQAVSWIRRMAADGEVESELLGNLHRVLADLHRDTDPLTAAAEYGHAVLRAFLFQRVDNALEHSLNAPDEYTQQFYLEMTTRAAQQMLAWGRHQHRSEFIAALVGPIGGDPGAVPVGSDAAVAAAADDAAESAERVVQVAGLLFPRGPLEAELHGRNSEFTDHWGDIVETLSVDTMAELDRIEALAARTAAGDPRSAVG